MKTKNKINSVSPALFREDNRIELLDVSFLKEAGSFMYNQILEEDSLRKVIDPELNFFYTITSFEGSRREKRQTSGEKGIAHIIKEKDKYFLKRTHLYARAREEGLFDASTEDGFSAYDLDDYLIIGCYMPNNFTELFILDNSILCTSEPLTPHPVQLEENCLIGRLDGDVQAIDNKELALILGHEHLIESLLKNDAPILAGSNYFELLSKNSKILANQIIAKPSKRRPSNREKGSIIFNEKNNCFEGFDGAKWRPLKWGDE